MPSDAEGGPQTPQTALQTLLDGNRRWIEGLPAWVQQSARRRPELADGQAPLATVFTCIDSRLAPEIVFDRPIGDLAVIRPGAHVLDEEVVLGSLEFAISILGTPLLLVMGHESCGAVRGAAARPTISSLIDQGDLAVHGGIYALQTGKVTLID